MNEADEGGGDSGGDEGHLTEHNPPGDPHSQIDGQDELDPRSTLRPDARCEGVEKGGKAAEENVGENENISAWVWFWGDGEE